MIQVWPYANELPNQTACQLWKTIQQHLTQRFEEAANIFEHMHSANHQIHLHIKSVESLSSLNDLIQDDLTRLFDQLDINKCQSKQMMTFSAMVYYSVRLDEELANLIQCRRKFYRLH